MNLFENVLKDQIQLDEIDNQILDDDIYTEAVYPEELPYMKIARKLITLPIGNPPGRGCITYLYTNNVNDTISIIENRSNFVGKNYYKLYFTPYLYKGKIYTKLFNKNLLKERESIYKQVSDKTGITPYPLKDIQKEEYRNMYFDLSTYISIFENIAKNYSIITYVNSYWEYLKSVILKDYPNHPNRFVVINADLFKIGKKIHENLTNPVYMIYYTLYKYPNLLQGLDIDFYIYSGLQCFKFNPSKFVEKESQKILALYKVCMNHIVKNPVEDSILNDAEILKSDSKDAVVKQKVKAITKNMDSSLNDFTNQVSPLDKSQASSDIRHENEIHDKKIENITKKVEDTITASKNEEDADKELENNEELIREIYKQNMGTILPKSPASSARDKKLKEEQKNIKLQGMTIGEIERINAKNIQIPVKDISSKLTTTNNNVKTLRYDNFEKTYNEKLMKKDMTDVVLSLNDKSIPMYVRKIEVEDSSDELNYKDTYRIYLEDANRQRHTVVVDIPKPLEHRFFYIGGNKKLIKRQNTLLPIVKISEDTVQLATNYNKMLVKRTDTRSISSIERLAKMMQKNDTMKSFFVPGNVYSSNIEFITTLELDELSKSYEKFVYKKSGCTIFFNMMEAEAYRKKNEYPLRDGKLFIGVNEGKPVYLDNETQFVVGHNKYIIDYIFDLLPEEFMSDFASITAPKRLMHTKVTVMAQSVATVMLLGYWEGLSSILTRAKVKYRVEKTRPSTILPSESVIRFADGYLVYENTVAVSLILNGLNLINTSTYTFEEMNTKEPYMGYFLSVYGNATVGNALINFYEFFIDPITKEILEDLNLPTNICDMMIYGISLLADSQYITDINQSLQRVRTNEIIPALLYEALANNYILYRNSNGKKKFSVPRDIVIKNFMAIKTVEDYSTLNPTLEMEAFRSISSKGFHGINLDDAYTLAKRSYDPSMIGIIAQTTSPDGSTGINRVMSTEPMITSMRGYCAISETDKEIDKLKDVNLFSPAELTMPCSSIYDDPSRLGHAIKQSKHVIPVKKSCPVLISNGFEETVRFRVTSDFAVNADEDGVVEKIDQDSKLMIVRYKSGKCRAVNLGGTIVKNSGGGFFLNNVMVTDLNEGDKVKKDDVIAYHKDFFTNDEFNNCSLNMGTLAKVAIVSLYNTYEDATFVTHKLSEETSTNMTFCRQVSIGKNSNVEYMVKEGDHVSVGDVLISFDTSYEDNELNALLSNLSEEQKDSVLEGSRNNIKSKYSGHVVKVKMYSTVELEEMSPSLRKIFTSYYNKIKKRNNLLNSYDQDAKNSIVKCGLLCDEPTGKIDPNKFGAIKGMKVEEGVIIEFYLEHAEPLEIGSKVAMFTGLKNTIGEVIPVGYEPYCIDKPEEEISSVIASNSILKRMVSSINIDILGNKCIVELKNKLKEIYNS